MALQTFDFSRLAPQQADNFSGIRDLFSNYLKGYEGSQIPMRMEQERKQREMANALGEINLKYAEPRAKADIAKAEAEASRAPFTGMSGPAAQAYSVMMLENQLGPDHPAVQQAKQLLRTEQAYKQASTANMENLVRTADKRYATPMGKNAVEISEIEGGSLPGSGGNIPLSPEEQAFWQGAYENKITKDTTNPQLQMRAFNAKNLDITAHSINPKEMLTYSGPKGSAAFAIDSAQAAAGYPSERFIKYEENVTRAKDLAKQLRLTLGESVQPSVGKALDELSNPGAWHRDPKVALAKYNANLELLLKESKTATEALQSPRGIGLPGKPQKGVPAKQEMHMNNQQPSGSMVMGIMGGKEFMIPADMAEQFVSDGGKVNGY